MDTLTARRSLQALRFGVVPSIAIEDITLLRAALVTTCRQLVNRDDVHLKGLVVEGEYGHGKSHTLRYLQARALRLGFAVSLIEIDEPLRASRFHRLYNALVGTMQVPDFPGVTGLRFLVAEWLNDATRKQILLDKPLPGPLRTALSIVARCRSGEIKQDPWAVEHTIWAWISGEPIAAWLVRDAMWAASVVPPSAVKLYSGSLQSLVDEVGKLLAGLGYSGWWILLDEVENITRPGTSIVTRANACRNLDFLLSPERRQVAAACALTPQARLDIERDSELQPWSFRGMPLIEEDGVTRWTVPKSALIDESVNRITLQPFSTEELVRLGQQVRALHARAHSWSAKKRVDDDALRIIVNRATDATSNPVRTFLRELVDVLDVALDHPDFGTHSLRWLA